MAQSGPVSDLLGKASGTSPGTIRSRFNELRAYGFIPMGRHGRGLTHGHFEASDLSNVLLTFAAGPAGVAALVLLLRNSWNGTRTAGEALAQIIEDYALDPTKSDLLPDEVALCVNPVSVTLLKRNADGSLQWIDEYRATVGQISRLAAGVNTVTILFRTMFEAAAELLRDTLKYPHRSIQDRSEMRLSYADVFSADPSENRTLVLKASTVLRSTRSGKKATRKPENETAASPGREAAAVASASRVANLSPPLTRKKEDGFSYSTPEARREAPRAKSQVDSQLSKAAQGRG